MREKLIKEEKIRPYLESFPGTRDSDEELMGRIWADDMCEYRRHHPAFVGKGLLQAMTLKYQDGRNALTNAKTIFRTRIILQHKHPHLRGDRYRPRIDREEPTCRAEAVRATDEVRAMEMEGAI